MQGSGDAPKGSHLLKAAKDSQPVAKKARKTNVVRGMKGALGAFAALPLDLLTEICYNVDYKTLYALTSTTKSFRATLLSPSAKPIWNRAREEAGLPELTAGELSDIQYADLVWGKGCKLCDNNGTIKTKYILRVRVCSGCAKTNVVSQPLSSAIYLSSPTLDALDRRAFICVSQQLSAKKYDVYDLVDYFLPHLLLLDARFKQDYPDWNALSSRTLMDRRGELLMKRAKDGKAIEPWEKAQAEVKADDRE